MKRYNVISGNVLSTTSYVPLPLDVQTYIELYALDHDVLISCGHEVPSDDNSFFLEKGQRLRIDVAVKGPIYMRSLQGAATTVYFIGT